MDNLTHSLLGLAVGEGVDRHLNVKFGKSLPSTKWLALAVSVVANNFPDLDLLYVSIAPKPLGYLLHHRGHTHTLLGLLPQLLLMALGVWLIAKLFRSQLSRAHWRRFWILAPLGLLLHVSLDALNIYGVHLLWPWDNRWFFGDLVFIIEPLYWALFLGYVASVQRHKWIWLAWAVLLAMAIFLGVKTTMLTGVGVVLLLGFALLTVCLWLVVNIERRFLVTGILFLGILSVFQMQQRVNLKIAHAQVGQWDRVFDVGLTPLPANPFCWRYIAIGQQQDEVVLQRSSISRVLFGFDACGIEDDEHIQQGSYKVATPSRETYKKSDLLDDVESNCRLAAWTRFARMPVRDSETLVDLRFSRGKRNFTTIDQSPRTQKCPWWVPVWTPPRQDLLTE